MRVISALWSLDRELDYLLGQFEPPAIGQRVLVPLGKQKSPEVAVVVAVLDESEHANKPIAEILREPPVLNQTHLEFLGLVARRHCVSLGEVLAVAIPDFMPRAALVATQFHEPDQSQADSHQIQQASRIAALTTPRSSLLRESIVPGWVELAIKKSIPMIESGRSVMICVPEQSDADLLAKYFSSEQPEVPLVVTQSGETKSQRYLRYRSMQTHLPKVAIVNRSGLLWQMANLGLIVVHDELDDSLREQSSPYYNAWELALLRSEFGAEVVIASPYRSAHIQRLVERNYLLDSSASLPLTRVEYSTPDEIKSKSILPFVKRCLDMGSLLVLTTRRGSNVNASCDGCGNPQTCNSCGGAFWINQSGNFECRACKSALIGRCQKCGGEAFRPGKVGATRIASDLGRALPGTRVVEVDAEHPASLRPLPNQIIVATVGSAPHLESGYSGLLVFDASPWSTSGHPTAELVAYRDWLAGIELLQPQAPVYLRNVDPVIARHFVSGKFVEVARQLVATAQESGLYPESKYLRVECDNGLSAEASQIITAAGAEVLSVSPAVRTTIVARIPTSETLRFGDAVRPWLRLQKPSKANPKRRPVTIEVDYEPWR